ncbi:MAG: hypothetical protein KatS3mg093_009 [Candidatus Parcubacteria bacterium]|nr:MAG: hypothetical protein KatS3mg093_009 [Candidatus Parcubacteria bacterium]
MYLPLIKKGGIIAFHDIVNKDKFREDIKVHIFWEEIKNRFCFKELIFDNF